jgi:hypothetical protein
LASFTNCQERHAFKLQHAKISQPQLCAIASGQQDAGHDRKAREMPLEDGVLLGNLRLDRNRLGLKVEVNDAIDQLK